MLDQVVSPHCLQTNPNINISVPTEWTASMIQHSKHMFMMFIRGSKHLFGMLASRNPCKSMSVHSCKCAASKITTLKRFVQIDT
jgi:hypothetical protein